MSDTPKFTVVDRRKFRADEEASTEVAAPVAEPERPAGAGPRLVEPMQHAAAEPEAAQPAVALAEEAEAYEASLPAPSGEEMRFQKAAYDKSAERLDDLLRAQNPGAPAPEKIGFEHLVQQLYLSGMMQMGAGTPEGQRPRIDILGARQTIDLLGVLLEKSKGNLSADETRVIDTVLFELRMTFLELTRMIAAQPPAGTVPPPGGAKR